ncbi:DNA helicase [Tanacetum coccineum]
MSCCRYTVYGRMNTAYGQQKLDTLIAECTSGHLKPEDRNKTLKAKVYRRWVAQNAPKLTPIGCCCILLDRQGNAIQANINVSDIEYFSQILEIGSTYMIPQPYSQGKIQHLVLIDYIGCVRSVGDLIISGDPNRRQITRRTVDMSNANIIEFTMWSDMAWEFDRGLVETIEALVIIVVSSGHVSRYKDSQLSASLATHYYLNPDIPKNERSQTDFKAFVSDETATPMFTFFTPSPDSITGNECPESVRKLDTPDPQRAPPEVLSIEGKRHTFWFRFNASSKLGETDFILEDVLDEVVDVDGIIKSPKDLPGTLPSLESTNIEDAGKTVARGETRIISATRLVLQNSSPEVKKLKIMERTVDFVIFRHSWVSVTSVWSLGLKV